MILISRAWSYVSKIRPDVFCNSMLCRCVQADNCFIELVLDISKVKTWRGKGSISRPSKDEKGFPKNWLPNQTIVKGTNECLDRLHLQKSNSFGYEHFSEGYQKLWPTPHCLMYQLSLEFLSIQRNKFQEMTSPYVGFKCGVTNIKDNGM